MCPQYVLLDVTAVAAVDLALTVVVKAVTTMENVLRNVLLGERALAVGKV